MVAGAEVGTFGGVEAVATKGVNAFQKVEQEVVVEIAVVDDDAVELAGVRSRLRR